MLQRDLHITQPGPGSADKMRSDGDDSPPTAFLLAHAVLMAVAEMQEVETPRSREA